MSPPERARDANHPAVRFSVAAEDLQRELRTHPSSDVATGVLMALYGYDELEAVAELRDVAQAEGVALPELCAALVALVQGHGTDGQGADGQGASRAADVARQRWGAAVRRNSTVEELWRLLVQSAVDFATDGARRASSLIGRSVPGMPRGGP